MHTKTLTPVAAIAIVLSGLAVLFLAGIVFSWTGPTGSPPNSNVAAPVNVGSTDQVKSGSLGVGGLAVFGNSLLQAASYLNWGSTSGSDGYGIRDNSGMLEYKNSGGTWQSLQAIIFALGGWNPPSGVTIQGLSGRNYFRDAEGAADLRVGAAWGVPGIYSESGSVVVGAQNSYVYLGQPGGSANVAIGASLPWNAIGWPGSLYVNGNIRGARYYDDDTNFYIDSNSTSVMNGMYLGWFWDRDNSGYYVDPNNTTVLNNVLTYGSVDTRGPIYMRYESFHNGDWYVCQSGQMLRLGAYCSASDERLKTNLEPITDVLDKLDNYRTVTFDWIDKEKRGDGRQIGVLAQDFANDYPELVSADPDTGYLSFDYQRLSAVLLEGLKELNAKVRGFAESFQSKEITTDKLCITASSGEKICVTGDELSALIAL